MYGRVWFGAVIQQSVCLEVKHMYVWLGVIPPQPLEYPIDSLCSFQNSVCANMLAGLLLEDHFLAYKTHSWCKSL